MRNANWTRILTILLALLAGYACLVLALGVIQRFFAPVLLVILAAILAYILTPVVDRFDRILRLPRILSVLITYIIVGSLLAGVGALLTAPLITQTRSLANAIKNPAHLANVQAFDSQTGQIVSVAKSYSSKMNSGTDFCGAVALVGSPGVATFCTNKPARNNLPHLVQDLVSYYLPPLERGTAVRGSGTTSHSTNNHPHPTIAASTAVPPSYVAPLRRDISNLKSALAKANADLAASSTSSATSPGHDALKVLRAAEKLNSAALHLRSIVKSTPIVLLGLQTRLDQHHIPVSLRNLFGQAVNSASGQGANVLNNAVTILTSTINVIFDLFIVLVMSFYLLLDGGRFIGWAMGIVPERNREQVWFFVKSLDQVLGGYIRGQVIVAITIGILAGTVSYVLGLPYAVLIGIFAFIAESIPVVGPVLASIPAILLSLFTQPILKTLIVVACFVVIQQIEQNVVGPRITGRFVGIHPIVAMVAILIGFEVGGFWGAFRAFQITGLMHVVTAQAYSYFVLRRPLPTATVPDTVELPEEEERPSRPPAAE